MKCLFCENPADSKEHVIPDWVLRHLGIQNEKATIGSFHETQGLKLHKTTQLKRLKEKIVCQKCNNEWMSTLDNWAAQRIKPMMNEGWNPEETLKELEIIRRDNSELTRWLLKIALATQAAAPESLNPAVTDAFLPIIKGNSPQENIHTFGAYLLEPGVAILLTKGNEVWKEYSGQWITQALAYGENEMSMNFSIQINHLGLKLTSTPHGRPILHAMPVKNETTGEEAEASALPLTMPRVLAEKKQIHAFPTMEIFHRSISVILNKRVGGEK